MKIMWVITYIMVVTPSDVQLGCFWVLSFACLFKEQPKGSLSKRNSDKQDMSHRNLVLAICYSDCCYSFHVSLGIMQGSRNICQDSISLKVVKGSTHLLFSSTDPSIHYFSITTLICCGEIIRGASNETYSIPSSNCGNYHLC